MTKITFDLTELRALMEYDITPERLRRTMPMLGCDLETIDEGGEITAEFFPSRPDLYSVEGVARALSAFIGINEGLKEYYVGGSNVKLFIDKSVLDIRPIMLSGIIRGIDIDDMLIRSMMTLQEKLHLTVGRKRAKVSIGLHDLDRVKPPFTYKAVGPTEVEFEPLGMEGEYMNLREILQRHDKGREYAYILKGATLYPLFVDAQNNILSFPPIINGVLTTVTENTRNILMDVTGTDINAVELCLNIILCALADRGGKLETVVIYLPPDALHHYKSHQLKPIEINGQYIIETPNMKPRTIDVSIDYIRKMIGMEFDDASIVRALKRMGMEAEVKGCNVTIRYPPYRGDILHPIDIVEDVAIGFGYDKITMALPETMTFGAVHTLEKIKAALRNIAIGLGYTEVLTLSLTNENRAFENMNMPVDKYMGDTTILANPLTALHTIVRPYILPSLMEIFSLNKNREMPQRIFEIGSIVVKGTNELHFAMAAIHPKASFTEIKSHTESVFSVLGIDDYSISGDGWGHEAFIPGRYAALYRNGRFIGFFGEIHPIVLEKWDLGAQVICLEINLSAIYDINMKPS